MSLFNRCLQALKNVYLLKDRTTWFVPSKFLLFLRPILLFLAVFAKFKSGSMESGDDSAHAELKLLNGRKKRSSLKGNQKLSVSMFALMRT